MANSFAIQALPLYDKYLEYTDWLNHQVLPNWFNNGFDENGASIESFRGDGSVALDCVKRSRVQARQMFVISYAHSRGWTQIGKQALKRIDGFLDSVPRHYSNDFFPHLLSQEKVVVDKNADLYDCAFFLLAYAWRFRVFGDTTALKKAELLINSIESWLRADYGGWTEGTYAHDTRRQNPHMHLFEAFMALYESTYNAKWLGYAGEMLSLFESRLFDADYQVVREYFTVNWLPHPQKGHIVEPGHAFEWVWLLDKYSSLTGKPLKHYYEPLYNNAKKHGVFSLNTGHQTIVNSVDLNGERIDSSQRLWPMTEWIKASLVMAAHNPSIPSFTIDTVNAITSLMTCFSHPNLAGHYVDKLNAQQEIIDDSMPASTLYHLVTAHQTLHAYMEEQL